MARIYIRHTLDELCTLVLKHAHEPAVLGPIYDELTYRDTDGAVQLRREVLALLRGEVPPPPRRERPDDPKNQIPLL